MKRFVMFLIIAFFILFGFAGLAREDAAVVDLVVEAEADGEIWNYKAQLFGDTSNAEGLLLLRREGEAAELIRNTLSGLSGGRPVTGKVDLRPYGKGAYELEVVATRANSTIARKKEKIYFLDAPWKKIDLDACEVVAPWTALQIEGERVSLLGREYEFGPGGLPQSMKSEERELLAGPVTLSAKVSGSEVEWDFSPVETVRRSEGAVEYAASAQAKSGENLSFKSSSTVEFDGLVMVDLRLDGKDISKISSLELSIPARSEVVRYIYRTGLDRLWVFGRTGLRTRPGLVVRSDFMPFVWLGNDDVGLFWFCDSNRAWPHSLAGVADAIEVLDEGSRVVLRLRIAAGGETLQSPWHFRFGVMATPVKPGGNGSPRRPRGWGISGTAGKSLGLTWPMPKVFYDACIPIPVHPEQMKRSVQASVKNGLIPMPYTAYALPATLPEWKVYGGRWHLDGAMDMYWGEAWSFHPEPGVEGAWMAMCPWTDFNKWFTWKVSSLLKEYGWRGYYRDGVYYAPCASRLHRHGRNGAYDFHMEPLRKHYRYLYTQIHKEFGEMGWVFHHSSGLIPIPLLAYADSVAFAEDLNGVNRYGGDYRKVVSLDELRNQFMGKAWGFVAVWISQLRGENCNAKNTRTLLALLLLHDIGNWGSYVDGRVSKRVEAITAQKFGFADSEYFPYFKGSTPAKAVGKDIYVSLYRKPDGRTMAVVANLTDKNLRTRVSFDAKGLGLAKVRRVSDLEYDIEFPVTDNSVRVVVRAADFRLFLVE